MGTPLIEFKDVTKRFGPRTILDRVNLQIYEGQVTTIIGLSGSGKSVLLKHIIGLLKPDEGTILFKGKPLATMKKKEKAASLAQISYMFQDNALFDSMTVYENIALPLREKTSLKKAEIDQGLRPGFNSRNSAMPPTGTLRNSPGGCKNGRPLRGPW